MANNTICCDRTNYHSDICFLKGNTITNSSSSSILLISNPNSSSPTVEKIRPYTRKWEPFIMNKIPELCLKTVNPSIIPRCDVRHSVTALFFSLGGYTGNIFHAFNNGLIPLYITSQHLNRQVVFVILEYRHWWYTKYREILSQLSAYPIIDFSNDERVHCFPEAIVGLRFHETLMIDPSRMRDNKSTVDFKTMLDQAYQNQNQIRKQKQDQNHAHKPKLVIVARKQTRAIENEQEVVAMARDIGFEIEVLRPENTMQMSTIYESLSTCDIMMGVHGAALTHFFFLRPESLFIQIVPLGLDELARMCFGDVAPKFGIEYEEYKIRHTESSLYTKYGGDDPIVRDPESVMKGKGWEFTKKVYLEGQNVTLDINRLRERLILAFQRGKQN
ncbi:EGF domain-specific O-linked N-acetylglucosamine transferase-like [Asparagus officinalis]|nr:EGF domain-specific O-linked N-acetylglucosamine transferase-like [Asparagus officinalis]